MGVRGWGGEGAIKLGRSYCNITIYLTVFAVVINLRVKWGVVVGVRGWGGEGGGVRGPLS